MVQHGYQQTELNTTIIFVGNLYGACWPVGLGSAQNHPSMVIFLPPELALSVHHQFAPIFYGGGV